MPPASFSFCVINSTFKLCRSANLTYIRYSSAANNDASSPPAPARISIIAGLSSAGSRGIKSSSSSSSLAAICSVKSFISACANSRSSASSSKPRASTRFFFNCSISAANPKIVFSSDKRRDFSAKSICVYASGRAKKTSIIPFSSASLWKSNIIRVIIAYIGLDK